jgi:2-oxoglutarate/2-oxoacid ferredoxin oxidoreductase subunit beta
VVSPCVAFNNHAGSTKSYDYVREHNQAVSRIDFFAPAPESAPGASYAPNTVIELPQPDGSTMRLRKLHEAYDPTDRLSAMNHVATHQALGEIVTGLLYVERDAEDLHAAMRTSAAPLNSLDARALCPGMEVLERLNQSLR